MKTFFELREKTLTPAEKKKREEVAKAIDRENPNMPMAKKMAIATATAKKVAEATQDLSSMGNRSLAAIANKQGHPDSAAAKNELARRKMKNESLEEGVSNLSHARLKFHATKGVPHGSYSNKEIKDEHNRRIRTEPDYVKAKASMNEETATDHKAERSYHIAQAAKAGITMAQRRAHRQAADLHGMADKDYTYAAAARKASAALKEEVALDEISAVKLGQYSAAAAKPKNQGAKQDKRIAGQHMADQKVRKKYGYSSDAKVAAGSLPQKESTEFNEAVKKWDTVRVNKQGDEHHGKTGVINRSRFGSHTVSFKNNKVGTYDANELVKKESVELDEVSQATKDRYIAKSAQSHQHNAAVARDAKSRGDETTYQKARNIMKKRNKGMTRAFGG